MVLENKQTPIKICFQAIDQKKFTEIVSKFTLSCHSNNIIKIRMQRYTLLVLSEKIAKESMEVQTIKIEDSLPMIKIELPA